MCGRFTLHTNVQQIAKVFEVPSADFELPPSYNIAPTQDVLTVVQHAEGRALEAMRWGLIPFWAKDASIGARMINARSETVAEKPAFKRSLKSRRCLVVADGFYEWRKIDGKKVPMLIRLKSQQPFGFAGLYDQWKSPEGEPITSCTIITTAANDLVHDIHDRMPVIVPRRLHQLWLDPANEDLAELASVLEPYSADEMEAFEVSRLVNSPRNNTPECIEPVAA